MPERAHSVNYRRFYQKQCKTKPMARGYGRTRIGRRDGGGAARGHAFRPGRSSGPAGGPGFEFVKIPEITGVEITQAGHRFAGAGRRAPPTRRPHANRETASIDRHVISSDAADATDAADAILPPLVFIARQDDAGRRCSAMLHARPDKFVHVVRCCWASSPGHANFHRTISLFGAPK